VSLHSRQYPVHRCTLSFQSQEGVVECRAQNPHHLKLKICRYHIGEEGAFLNLDIGESTCANFVHDLHHYQPPLL
jgi:hypothetical protein